MNTLALVFLVPLLTALGILFGLPARRGAQIGAILQLALVLLLAITFLFDSIGNNPGWRFTSSVPALTFGHDAAGHPVGISLSLGVNGLSIVLLLLTAIVTTAATFLDQPGAGERGRQLGTLFISAGAAGAFCSTDLFFFFAFHELALVPTLLLIAHQGRSLREDPRPGAAGGDQHRTAWLTTLYLGAGSLVLLAGLVATVAYLTPEGQPWNFSFLALRQHVALSSAPLGDGDLAAAGSLPALLLILGFGTLVSLFPFHSWAARAYAAAPAPTTMMHAGVLKKFGLYGLLQFALPLLPAGLAHWALLLMVLLLGNILVIGLVTIAQRRLDSLLGNSSVMHMGYLFLAVAVLLTVQPGPAHDAAYAGAVLLMFAHGISVALSFGLLGRLEARTGTLEIARLGGLARRMPTLTLLFGLALFAGIGLPGLANFAGEFMIFLAGFGDLRQWALGGGTEAPTLQPLTLTTLLAILGVLISAIYALRAFRRVFHEGSAGVTGPGETLHPGEVVPAATLAAILLIVGCFPNVILQFV